MSRDIVARLRDIAALRGPMAGAVIPIACTEAADEIERLQAEVKTWMEIAHGLFKTHGHDWLFYEEHMCGDVTNGCGGYLCECGYPWSMKSGCDAAEALRRYEEASRD